MFYLYLALVVVPPFAFYRFITRDDDDGTATGLGWAVAVLTVQFLLVVAGGGWIAMSFASVIFGFAVFLLYGMWKLKRDERESPISIATIVQATAAPIPRVDSPTIAPVDLETIDDPLANWKRTTPREPSRPRGAARRKAAPASKPPPLKGRKLDVVRFDYRNAEGEYSSRRLVVQVIGENYFEGFDPDKLEARTFRYDRVVGGIVSELTGEIIVPGDWSPAKQ